MKTIIIILSKDSEYLEIALENCRNLLGKLNTEMYGDGYPIILYNKGLTKKEKEVISTELYNKNDCYTLFLECSDEVIKETAEDEKFFYVNAILCDYGKNQRNA